MAMPVTRGGGRHRTTRTNLTFSHTENVLVLTVNIMQWLMAATLPGSKDKDTKDVCRYGDTLTEYVKYI